MSRKIAALSALSVLVGCSVPAPPEAELRYAIAIHGGAGVISEEMPVEERRAYETSLAGALRLGVEILDGGGRSLDAVERVIRILEDDPKFNAGKGAVFNHEGENELDASIMEGGTLACGAVAGVRTVKNPISLARLVMERTDHVLLAGEGAERFAEETGVDRVPADYFFTPRRWEALRRALERDDPAAATGTVGVVALDTHGNLAAGTSTGGLTNKRYGRIGDSPIIGAGTYADNRTCAVSATGRGEEFIRHGVAREISARMEHLGTNLDSAVRGTIEDRLRPGEGGVIAVSRSGEIAMVFNTPGMYRGAADSSGRFEVHIRD